VIYWLLYQNLLLRVAGTAVVSFLIIILMGPRMIRWLLKRKLGDRPEFDHADLNELTRRKSDTPTMGGILISTSILLSVLLFANLGNMYIRMGLLGLVWLTVLGGIDDWLKLKRASGATTRDGLKSWQKLLFQVGLAVLLAVFMRAHAHEMSQQHPGAKEPAECFYFPFKSDPIALPAIAFTLITILTMVGTSNAVNLTDGMDGLASGCMVIVCGVFLVLSWLVGTPKWAGFFHMPYVRESGEMVIFCASMLGACLGFMWFNAHPAQVFMGDTGSLPLGGLLGYVAVVTRQELLLVIAGGVFVMEAVSVVLQVSYFKWTKRKNGMQGKRLFRCAPIHHHFHLGGWAEPKVVVRFWLLCAIFAALALATLKLR
jgi:phospho-N-acetylmuramoyl-pentapeptide-transferase